MFLILNIVHNLILLYAILYPIDKKKLIEAGSVPFKRRDMAASVGEYWK